ncbi:DUF4344 domain-containing metallopeptidase [Shewanella sp. WXL01]|uniref:DUF4344 domain-containing metallopeptidase n=1 Tax=Shewanella sp. WXL01 TaxID=2709721 RepID=UPI001FD9D5B1|nr:DUF4344 domain-containing metallopeptidase [Shewanella sp. WXL01]
MKSATALVSRVAKLALASSIMTFCAQANAESFNLEYLAPQSSADKQAQQALQSANGLGAISDFINQTFDFDQPINLVVGTEDGPYYDSSDATIAFPYWFYTEVKQRFTKANYGETGVSVADASLDAMVHTTFHELAHAVIDIHQLPVVGKEEDAADGLASVLMIEFFDNGADMAISAADLFDLESEDREVLEDADFWDEHSLNEQRYFSTLCHVYGSNPDAYQDMIKQQIFTAERGELCIEEYQILAGSWYELLSPMMKQTDE